VRTHLQEPSGNRPLSRSAEAALTDASSRILGPFRNELPSLHEEGIRTLIFCPHGPLAFFPFHLLPFGDGVLADRFEIVVIPTLGFLLPGSRERTDALRDPRLGIVASPDGGVPFRLPAEPRIWEQAERLGDANAITARKGECTPDFALDSLRSQRRVHIAAHGAGLGSAPAFHRLFLDSTGTGSGELFAYRVAESNLRGLELVTLCACETALGRVDPAGNLRGLPSALLGAGAQTVVATLWPVAATPALHFFTAIHAALDVGATRLEAFTTAQRETRAVFPKAVDWGAFAYLGRWTEI
jgi:CHAT domain-containing protein